jgi:RHS repeat-associated protein
MEARVVLTKFVARLYAALSLMVLCSPAAAGQKTVVYYYTDPQGTVLATADASGNVLNSRDVTPYGRQISGLPDTGPGFTGHVEDPDSGLVYMQHRYYDPVVGRFLSVDSIHPRPGRLDYTNRYAYVGDNPVNRIDPSGDYICTGSGKRCDKIESALSDVKKAASALPAGSAGQKALTAIANFYGAKGVANGVNVGFGNAGGNNAVTDTKGKETYITFNLASIRQTGLNSGTTPKVELAATVAHEGQHGIDGQEFGRPQNHGEWDVTENNSFISQSYINQATDTTSPYGLWVHGWQESPITNALRESAAAYNADWTVYGSQTGP